VLIMVEVKYSPKCLVEDFSEDGVNRFGSDGISTPYFAAATMTFSMSGGLTSERCRV
jgi:hypothetical protein